MQEVNMDLDKKRIDRIVRFALKEDIGTGDVTSKAVLDKFLKIDAVVLSRAKAIVCGMEIVERVFAAIDYNIKFRPLVKDGDAIKPDQEIAFVEGDAREILKAERTALNFLGMLSGIATATKSITEKVEGSGIKIYDTRKTIPFHRYLSKYAVTIGGGYNHRTGLWDMALIKDNHIKAFGIQAKKLKAEELITEIVKRAKKNVQKNIRVEIEVENLTECEYALGGQPHVIMLDNMSPETIKKAVKMRKDMGLEGQVLFEVSGGISQKNIAEYIDTGVDIISIGALTGSIDPVDFSLEIIYHEN